MVHRHAFAAHERELGPARGRWAAGERRQAIAAVPDAAVDAVCSVGDPVLTAARVVLASGAVAAWFELVLLLGSPAVGGAIPAA